MAGDRAAMRAALEQIIATGLLSDGLLTDTPWMAWQLRPECSLTGTDTIEFLHDVWPSLLDMPWLTTEVHGTPLDYRVATGEPVIQLDGEDTLRRRLVRSGRLGHRRRPAGAVRVDLPGARQRRITGDHPAERHLLHAARATNGTPCATSSRKPAGCTTCRPTTCGSTGTRRRDGTTSRPAGCSVSRPPHGGTGSGPSRLARAARPSPLPAAFQADLRGYQQEGFDWLRRRCTTAVSAASSPTTWGWARPCRPSA